MLVTYTTPTRMFVISDVRGLDPVTVILHDHDPGRGTLIVKCYDQAWTAYWGAMSGRTLAKFLQQEHSSYIADNLIRGPAGLMTRKSVDPQTGYLERIAEAIQAALRQGAAS